MTPNNTNDPIRTSIRAPTIISTIKPCITLGPGDGGAGFAGPRRPVRRVPGRRCHHGNHPLSLLHRTHTRITTLGTDTPSRRPPSPPPRCSSHADISGPASPAPRHSATAQSAACLSNPDSNPSVEKYPCLPSSPVPHSIQVVFSVRSAYYQLFFRCALL